MATTTTDKPMDRRAREVTRGAIGSIVGATDEVEARLGAAADVTGSGVRVTSQALRRRSDATLAMLGSFSVGLTTGFLVGGANRLLTAVSLVPAALVGGVILERLDRPRRHLRSEAIEELPLR